VNEVSTFLEVYSQVFENFCPTVYENLQTKSPNHFPNFLHFFIPIRHSPINILRKLPLNPASIRTNYAALAFAPF
jgi:hypothetical protein